MSNRVRPKLKPKLTRSLDLGPGLARRAKDTERVKYTPTSYTSIDSMMHSGSIKAEVAKGRANDLFGRALRIRTEDQAYQERQGWLLKHGNRGSHIRSERDKEEPTVSRGGRIRSGDTVMHTARKEKFTVLKTRVDIAGSGEFRHLVQSHKSGDKMKIPEDRLEKI